MPTTIHITSEYKDGVSDLNVVGKKKAVLANRRLPDEWEILKVTFVSLPLNVEFLHPEKDLKIFCSDFMFTFPISTG